MRLRILSLSILGFLTACNNNSESPASESTFISEAAPIAVVEQANPSLTPNDVEAASAPRDMVVNETASTMRHIMTINNKPTVLELAKPLLTPEEVEAAAYAAVAPPDTVVKETTFYDTTINGSVTLADVNETVSAMRHTMTINGKPTRFTARAGHLVAYAAATGKDPAGKSAEAAIFYTAYTRDDLPREKRPVTFFWNGGPGSSSIWLHMGSWGPKRLKSDAPNILASAYTKQPDSFPFIDNEITLLEQSDLVFVDPPGTGHSTAVFPHRNLDFWGTDIDAKVVADFITRYNNVNNRQSSPKYLYGESYGGIRTPIVANLLEAAGTSRFDADPSGKPPTVLSGYILNSPLVDYTSTCDDNPTASCAGFAPSYAMAADYFKKSTRTTESQADFLQAIKRYTKDIYTPTYNKYVVASKLTPEGKKFIATKEGADFLAGLAKKTGLNATIWTSENLNVKPSVFREKLIPGFMLGRFDARMKVPGLSEEELDLADKQWDFTLAKYGRDSVEFKQAKNFYWDKVKYYAPDDYIDVAFPNQFSTYLSSFVNYQAVSNYESSSDPANHNWVWKRAGQSSNNPVSIPDIQSALTYDPALKLLILHGYEDIATPGYQTELDLAGAGLGERIPVKWFEGGHMIYNTEVSRPLLKETLDQYYLGAPHDPQTAPVAQAAQQSKTISAFPLTPVAAAN